MAFVLLDQSFHSGMMLALAQNLNVFNAASRGAITLKDRRLPGQYVNNVGWNLTEDVWTRRDPTSIAAAASGDRKSLGELNKIGVICHTKAIVENSLGNLAQSMGQDIPTTSEGFSRMVGSWVATSGLKKKLNHGILAARAAIKGQSESVYTATNNSAKANAVDLNLARATMGDAVGLVQVNIMHSKPWFDLVGNQVVEKYPDVTGFNLFQGIPATYGVPTLVTDSASLVGVRGSGSAAVPEYYTLGLVSGAVDVESDTAETATAETITGLENLMFRLQAQGSHSLAVKGFKYDVANGGANPTDTTIGTSTNWDVLESGAPNQKKRAGYCFVTL